MQFGAPYMASLLWLVPAVILFYMWASHSRKKALGEFASSALLPEMTRSYAPRRRKLKNTMLVTAVLFLTLALMRPQWGYKWQEVKRSGLDILIALDTSNSMLAEDVLPNRIERSKLAIRDLVKKLEGDRVGLIAFAGTAFLQCPLTVDYNGFLLTLDDVNVSTIPIGGTSLSRTIYTALRSYEGGAAKYKVLIIITDGEDLEGGVDNAIKRAKTDGVRIFCVGIGTPEGELIPLDYGAGKREFLKDKEGNVVKSRLNEEMLQRIALDTGGVYIRATGARFGLDIIYDEWLSKMEKQEFQSKMEKKYTERFEIPLALALALLFIEPLIGDRRREGI